MKVFDYDEMTSVMQHLFDKNEVLEELQNEMNNAGIAELASCTKMLGDMIANNEEDIEDIRRVRNNIFDQGGRASYIDFDEINKGHHEKLEEVRFRIKMLRETLKVTDANIPSLLESAQTFVDISNIDNLRYFIDKGVSTEAVSRLKKLGYKEELLSIIEELSKEDIKALNLLGEGEYEKVFKINPDTLSANMNFLETDILSRIVLQEMEENPENMKETMKLMNALNCSKESEYTESTEYKHLLRVTAGLELMINSNALSLYNNKDSSGNIPNETNLKKTINDNNKLTVFYNLCYSSMYLNTQYEGIPKLLNETNIGGVEYLNNGFIFNTLSYDTRGEFIFSAEYRTTFKADIGKSKIEVDMSEIEGYGSQISGGGISIYGTESAREGYRYDSGMGAIKLEKEAIVEDFIKSVATIAIGIYNPALGALVAAGLELCKDENGEKVVSYTLDKGKYIVKKGFESMDGRTKEGKKWKSGVYGKTALSIFDFSKEIYNLTNKMEELTEKEKEVIKQYNEYIKASNIGEITNNKSKNNVQGNIVTSFESAPINGNRAYVLGQVNRNGIKGFLDEEANRKLKTATFPWEKGTKDPVYKTFMAIRDGGYDFNKLGDSDGTYDIDNFKKALKLLNTATGKDIIQVLDGFDDDIGGN